MGRCKCRCYRDSGSSQRDLQAGGVGMGAPSETSRQVGSVWELPERPPGTQGLIRLRESSFWQLARCGSMEMEDRGTTEGESTAPMSAERETSQPFQQAVQDLSSRARKQLMTTVSPEPQSQPSFSPQVSQGSPYPSCHKLPVPPPFLSILGV